MSNKQIEHEDTKIRSVTFQYVFFVALCLRVQTVFLFKYIN